MSQISPQNPFDTHPEKGPSTFDIAHTFTLSLAQDLHGEDVALLQPLGKTVTGGWELLSISSINSGSPFTVYSGVQQTDAGTSGADRPDQVGIPHLSTSRKTREDYFGLGADNASYFSFLSTCLAARVRITDASVPWVAILSAGRPITTSTLP